MKRRLIRLSCGFFAFYLVFVLALYVTQRSHQYVPDTQNPTPASSRAPGMAEIMIKTADGLINESWLSLPRQNQKMIVMFHGNASHVGGRAFKAQRFIERGYGFMIVGYRGYGGNQGSPNETGLYQDAAAAVDYLINQKKITPQQMIFYGESLGTGVATHMALLHPDIAGLILEVPFDSAFAVAKRRYPFVIGLSYLMHDQYRSDLRVPLLSMPKLFLIAGQDWVVPPDHARRLYELAAEPKKVVEFPDGQHNNLYDHGAAEKILEFIDGL
jgi:hypothetical protein